MCHGASVLRFNIWMRELESERTMILETCNFSQKKRPTSKEETSAVILEPHPKNIEKANEGFPKQFRMIPPPAAFKLLSEELPSILRVRPSF